MAKQDLQKKTVRELRTMAKRAGIAVKRDWKKEDLVKVLSSSKKSAAKPAKPTKKTKLPKKSSSRKTEDKQSIAYKKTGNKATKKSLKKKAQTAKQRSV